MKKDYLQFASALLLLATLPAPAAVLYVDGNSAHPVPPYDSWNTAATVIQDAVDAAAPGDQILVTNGLYQTGGRVIFGSLTNRVALNKAVALQSVNGPAVTIIAGNPVVGDTAVRCAYLTNGASLTGFTLTQGATRINPGDYREESGGGAWCESTSTTFTNCVFAANQARFAGGGIEGGTLEGCTLYHCTLVGNSAGYRGGGATDSTLNDCVLAGNSAGQYGGGVNASTLVNCLLTTNSSGYAGGAANGNTLNNCTLVGNSAGQYGGGAKYSTLNDCVLAGNSAGQYGGGVSDCTLANCLLTTNSSGYIGGGANLGTLNNCTLVGNSARYGGGAYQATLSNCIAYYNYGTYGDSTSNSCACTLVHCCTAPGARPGNFTNAPGFVDLAQGDYHLQAGSFCINAGDNAAAAGTVDLDGNPRVVGPYIDVGAYEYQAAAPVPLSVGYTAAYTNVAAGFAVAFTGAIAGYETASFWDFGDGTQVTNQLSLSHAWASAGSYVVTFTAWNDDHPAGLSASLTVLVQVNPTYYVAQGSPNPVPPYSSWATAAANIQDAVDAASCVGGTVWVSNGVYQTGGQKLVIDSNTNRVTVTKPLTLQSVNGPAVTIIKGYRGPNTTPDRSSVRCVWLSTGTTLSGFTLSNGGCLDMGGGVQTWGSGSITNCILTGNAAGRGGGGGGGIYYYNCLIAGNSAASLGGGIYSGVLNNCLVVSNSAADSGGGVYGGTLTGCTVVGNRATNGSGGGLYWATAYNSIIYYNTISSTVSGASNTTSGTLTYCCTTPQAPGTGNLTTPPAFANLAGGDFHLQASSPCINAGDNNSVIGNVDLDGNPRIQFNKVDLGPYEFQKAIHFVVPPGLSGPSWPYTTWATAAANIQNAVDAAAPGGFIVVTNGTYSSGGRVVYGYEANRVVLTNGVTLLSVNGAPATTITGGANTRCVYVGSNSLISGFTLSGGQTLAGGDITREQSGGGAWCETGGVVSNCFISGNSALPSGGLGGGLYGGTAYNCTLSNNNASFGGGAAAAALQNCLLVSNSAPYSPPFGFGGALYQAAATNCTLAGNGWGYGVSGGGAYQSTLANCLLVTNLSTYGGGGAQNSLLANCTLSRNQGQSGGTYQCTNWNCTLSANSGSSGGGMWGGVAYNSLLVSNTAAYSGGGAYVSSPANGALYNCTVVGNRASNGLGGGLSGATAYNSIIYYNTAFYGANYANCSLRSCWTYPPTLGNSSEPSFVDLARGNFRLQTNSPCINSGDNTYLTNSTDLDGNPRLVAGTVDIGAYEFQNPVSAISYAWLQQYGLPINASTDTADPDGDGMNNWQEWRAGTIPTSASSVLKLLAPTGDASGITVSWQSVSGKSYYLLRSTNLTAVPAFYPLQSNLLNTSSWKDSSATNAGPYFYRVGVQ